MRYTAKKIATMLLTMVIVSFLTFVAFSLLSGDAATRLLGTEATPERLLGPPPSPGRSRSCASSWG